MIQHKQDIRKDTLEVKSPMSFSQKERKEYCCPVSAAQVDPVCFNADFFDGNCHAQSGQKEVTTEVEKVTKKAKKYEEPVAKEAAKDSQEASKDPATMVDKIMSGVVVGDFTSNHLKEQESLSQNTLKCLIDKQQELGKSYMEISKQYPELKQERTQLERQIQS